MRIAVIVPKNNTTMAGEVAALAPAEAAVTAVRVERGKGLLTKADIPAYKDRVRGLLPDIAANRPDLVLYGCTAAGFLSGASGDAAFAQEIEQTVGAPTVSTAGAMGAILKREAGRKVAVVSPYSEEVNQALSAFLADDGFAVTQLLALEAADVEALGKISAEEVRDAALGLDAAGFESLFIACSQLPTLGIVAGLRAHFVKPVWTSILATATLGLERLGCPIRQDALADIAA